MTRSGTLRKHASLAAAAALVALSAAVAPAAATETDLVEGSSVRVFIRPGGCLDNGCSVRLSRKNDVNRMVSIDTCRMFGHHDCVGRLHNYGLDTEYDGWVIYVQTPDTTITSGPGAETTEHTVTFEFTGSVAGSTFFCWVDGGPSQMCNSPYTTIWLNSGPHVFYVAARSAQNVQDDTPASYAFTINPIP